MDNQGRRWVIVAVSLVVLALCASTVAVLNVFLIREPQSAETTAVSPEIPPDGLLIIHIVPDSPAERAGLQWGSFITAVNDTPMLETADLTNALQEAGAGSSVTLTLLVNGRSQTRTVTLNNAPPLLGVQVVSAGGIAPSASPQLPVTSRPWAQIRTVQPDTPASAAGLVEGDIVTAVDGQVVLDTAEFVAAIEGKQPGTAVALTVRRDTETLTLNATLTSHPDDPAKPYLGVILDE